MSFLKDFYTKYLSLNVKDYLGEDFNFQINKVLLFLAIGLCFACVFINYNQSIIARLLKKLIRLDAFSEDNGKTLEELGLSDHKPTKTIILKNFGAVRRTLGVVGRKALTYEEYIALEKAKKISKKARLTRKSTENDDETDDLVSENYTELDFSVARFFIIPEERSYAERYIRTDSSPLKTSIYCALILLFFLALILTMPYLLKAARGIT